MRYLNSIIHAIDVINEHTGRIVIWLAIVLTCVTGFEIISRYVFNAPTKWAFDISYMIGGSFFVLGQGFTLKNKNHVRIDLFYSRFSPRGRAWIDTIFYLVFFFPLWIGLLYNLIPYVLFAWKIGERSMQGYWRPILYPFKTVMPVGVLLLLLQGVAEFIRALTVLFKKGRVS